VDAELLPGIVDRARLVPGRYRVFDQDASSARRIFRIGDRLLSELLDLGLPHRSSGGERRFDELDLANASLTLRLPSPRYLAMRRWPETLRSVVDGRPVRYEVQVSATCGSAEPGHPCDFRLPAEVLALGAEPDAAAGRFTLRREVGACGRAGQAPGELRPLFDEVSRFHYYILPLALYGDLSFLAATGLANCELASRYLAERAAEEGWESRRSFGLLLSSPYSLHHFWPEVRLDGGWCVFDPFLIVTLERWGVLAAAEIPSTQALTSAVVRIAEDWVELVEDAGRPAPVSLLTRRERV
jgi:hypothetical protein